MAGSGEEEWAPKTRDDWRDLFKESFLGAMEQHQSAQEEAAAKKAAEEAANGGSGTSDNNQGGESGNGDNSKPSSFAERFLSGRL